MVKLPGWSERACKCSHLLLLTESFSFSLSSSPFPSLHFLPQVNSLQAEHSLSFPLVSHFLLIPAAPWFFFHSFSILRTSKQPTSLFLFYLHLLHYLTLWQPPIGFLPDHSYFSLHFSFFFFPPQSFLMPSCGATGVCIDGNTWPWGVSVCHSGSAAESLWL